VVTSLYCIDVVFTVRAGRAAAFRAAVLDNARSSLADEPGCRVFDVCVDDSGQRFFLYELYDDAAAFDAHLATPHFKAFDAMVAPWVLDKTVRRWTRLAADAP
jgi:(4S)-4-hydroxy-5-phosphonooxypentane-2,3-dione isomerase